MWNLTISLWKLNKLSLNIDKTNLCHYFIIYLKEKLPAHLGKSLYRKNHIDILSSKTSKTIDIPFKLDFKLRGVLRKENLK